MPTKTKPARNVLEQAEGIAADAWEKTGKIAKDTAKTTAQDISAQASFSNWLGLGETLSPEAVKLKEDEELIRKLDGYKDIFRKIDEIEGRATDEKALDEKVRKYIEEEKKKATESYREMKTEHKSKAGELSTSPRSQQETEDQRKKTAAEEENRRKQEEQAKLDNVVETPPGPQKGPSFKGKRTSHPRRGTPRATANLRSAETRSNRE